MTNEELYWTIFEWALWEEANGEDVIEVNKAEVSKPGEHWVPLRITLLDYDREGYFDENTYDIIDLLRENATSIDGDDEFLTNLDLKEMESDDVTYHLPKFDVILQLEYYN